jgi:hypothetical protein
MTRFATLLVLIAAGCDMGFGAPVPYEAGAKLPPEDPGLGFPPGDPPIVDELPASAPIACAATDVGGILSARLPSPWASACGTIGPADHYLFAGGTVLQQVTIDVERTDRVRALVIPASADPGDPCLASGDPATFTAEPGVSYYIIAAAIAFGVRDDYELEIGCN